MPLAMVCCLCYVAFMWLLILVFALELPNWPEDQAYPTADYVIEFQTERECLAMRDLWLTETEAQPPGWDPRWYPLLQGCEPKAPLIS